MIGQPGCSMGKHYKVLYSESEAAGLRFAPKLLRIWSCRFVSAPKLLRTWSCRFAPKLLRLWSCRFAPVFSTTTPSKSYPPEPTTGNCPSSSTPGPLLTGMLFQRMLSLYPAWRPSRSGLVPSSPPPPPPPNIQQSPPPTHPMHTHTHTHVLHSNPDDFINILSSPCPALAPPKPTVIFSELKLFSYIEEKKKRKDSQITDCTVTGAILHRLKRTWSAVKGLQPNMHLILYQFYQVTLLDTITNTYFTRSLLHCSLSLALHFDIIEMSQFCVQFMEEMHWISVTFVTDCYLSGVNFSWHIAMF